MARPMSGEPAMLSRARPEEVQSPLAPMGEGRGRWGGALRQSEALVTAGDPAPGQVPPWLPDRLSSSSR